MTVESALLPECVVAAEEVEAWGRSHTEQPRGR
jgi:hypothetical protein